MQPESDTNSQVGFDAQAPTQQQHTRNAAALAAAGSTAAAVNDESRLTSPQELAAAAAAAKAAADAAVTAATRAAAAAAAAPQRSAEGEEAATRSMAITVQLAQLQEESRQLQQQSMALQQRAMAMSLKVQEGRGGVAAAAYADGARAREATGGDGQQHGPAADYDGGLHGSYTAEEENAEDDDEQGQQDEEYASLPREPTPTGSETSSRGGLISWNIPSRGSGMPSPTKLGGLSPSQPRSPYQSQIAANGGNNNVGGFAQ